MSDLSAGIAALRDLEKQARQYQSVLRLAEALSQGAGLEQQLKELTAAVEKTRAEAKAAVQERDGAKATVQQMVALAKKEADGIRRRAEETAETKLAQAEAQLKAVEGRIADLQKAHDVRVRGHEDTIAGLGAEIMRLERELEHLTATHSAVKEKLRSLVA